LNAYTSILKNAHVKTVIWDCVVVKPAYKDLALQ